MLWSTLTCYEGVIHLKEELLSALAKEGIEISLDECYLDAEYRVIFRDVLLQRIQKKLEEQGISEREAIIKSSEITEKLLSRINCVVSDSWALKIEKESCIGCPAFKWVIHQNGMHPCRLGFDIEEKDNTASPVTPCLRPQTVGVSYQIARELGRPKPMVGKLDYAQYEQYRKEAAGC
jgi:hypothetical protein